MEGRGCWSGLRSESRILIYAPDPIRVAWKSYQGCVPGQGPIHEIWGMINFDGDLQSLTDGPVISIDNIDNNNDSDTFDPALQALWSPWTRWTAVNSDWFRFPLSDVHCQVNDLNIVRFSVSLGSRTSKTRIFHNAGLMLGQRRSPVLAECLLLSGLHPFSGSSKPFNRQIIQSEFSPTWSCVSLTRSTTSSEWKLFRFDKMEVNSSQIVLIDITIYL